MNKGKKKKKVEESSDEDSDSDYVEEFGCLDLEDNSSSDDSSYAPDSEDASTLVKPNLKNKGQNEAQQAYPRIFGHEAAGIVESVGEGVEDIKVGDRVLPVFTEECSECRVCQRDGANLCERFRVDPIKKVMVGDGTTRFFTSKDNKPIYPFLNTSTLSEYTVVDSACVVKVDPRFPLEKMCLLSCGVSTEK